MDYKKIIRQAIDLHVHIGPEIIPRKYQNVEELIKDQKGKIGGVGIKNHFFPAISSVKNKKIKIINSVTLNNYQGGFNSEVARACAEISDSPITVWFPTISADNFLEKQEYELDKKWIDPKLRNKSSLKKAEEVKGLNIFDKSGKIKNEVIRVLKIIKKYNAILATGHISWQESFELVKKAKEIGIEKIIITHPIYQKIDMPIERQKRLTETGAYIEQCYSMYSIDKIAIKKIAEQIKYLESKNCIISSDVGQVFSKAPSEALKDFIVLLEKEGLEEKDFKKMLIDNPEKLIDTSSLSV